jgi:hypothetical protein
MSDNHTRTLFEWLNQVADDVAVPPGAFKLAYVIGQHLNRKTGIAFPKQGALAVAVGTSVRTVRTLLDQLEAAGHLSITGTGGRQRPNDYRPILKTRKETSTFSENEETGFLVSDEKPGNPASETWKFSAQNVEAGFLASQPSEQPLKQPSESLAAECRADPADQPSQRRANVDDQFAEWWPHYPKRVKRKAAEALYRQILKKREATQKELLQGVMRYAAECADRPSRFIMHPTRWLKDGCWADESSSAAEPDTPRTT